MSSRRGTLSQSECGVLVDTTFLLPALGVEVEEEAMSIIPLFRMVNIYYLEEGLLEALWKVVKVIPPSEVERLELGIRAIRSTYKLLIPSAAAFTLALKLYREGHRDYIDDLYYASALLTGVRFLTLDKNLIKFLESRGYSVRDVILVPRDLPSYVEGCSKA